jgi:hypothetical protein
MSYHYQAKIEDLPPKAKEHAKFIDSGINREVISCSVQEAPCGCKKTYIRWSKDHGDFEDNDNVSTVIDRCEKHIDIDKDKPPF